MGSLWEEFGEEEGWGILLVDVRNAFNELNRKAMLWHQGGVTQGNPMAMFLYALGAITIINQLRHHQLDVESLSPIAERLQAWYANDLAKAGFFEAIQECFKELCLIGPPLRYFPEPNKSVLVTALQNLDLAKTYFEKEEFKIKTGYCYLGGHIGEGKEDYVTENVLEWVESVHNFSPW
eukprot:3859380-Ditylum_brightwellii.AAC.1